MVGLRRKLSLGFGGLLLIILITGGQSIFQFRELGQSVDVILRENYRSVVACREMKEANEKAGRKATFATQRMYLSFGFLITGYGFADQPSAGG